MQLPHVFSRQFMKSLSLPVSPSDGEYCRRVEAVVALSASSALGVPASSVTGITNSCEPVVPALLRPESTRDARSRILIVSHRLDPHADVVADLLRRRGHDPVLLCTSDLPGCGGIRIRVGSDGRLHAELSTARGTLELAEVGAVWWKRALPHRAGAELPEIERDWAERETEQTLAGLFGILARDPGVYWLGEPGRIRAASFKVEQLHRAASFGFTVPQTLISTDPLEVRQFVKEHAGGVVHKDLGNRFLGPPSVYWGPIEEPPAFEVLLPTLVKEAHLESIDTVTFSPCLFQAFIPKHAELRVTVVENQVFPCVIQQHGGSSPWMTAKQLDDNEINDDFDYSACEIPDTLRQRCVELVHSYGLAYGALDIAITPEGDYIFFELNPDGDWIHIQERVPALDIASAVASTLARHCATSTGPRGTMSDTRWDKVNTPR
ncbi:ATP-grasp domain-containing protein [Streptomyces sp. MMBL 11-3]|uniref:ATP-grasp domain-containing protein n=1 Tax=Streptomyces sp. MMBL 11-3 TaxID=3382639 RepID=UPI0039B68A9E